MLKCEDKKLKKNHLLSHYSFIELVNSQQSMDGAWVSLDRVTWPSTWTIHTLVHTRGQFVLNNNRILYVVGLEPWETHANIQSVIIWPQTADLLTVRQVQYPPSTVWLIIGMARYNVVSLIFSPMTLHYSTPRKLFWEYDFACRQTRCLLEKGIRILIVAAALYLHLWAGRHVLLPDWEIKWSLRPGF